MSAIDAPRLYRRNLAINESWDFSKHDSDSQTPPDMSSQGPRDPTGTDEKSRSNEMDRNLIVLEGTDDPLNPQNFTPHSKWLYATVLGLITLMVTFASTVFSTATTVTAKEFGVSSEVMTLGTTLFVFGFAAGPIVAGPTSELYGRKYPLLIGYFVFIIFQIPVAVAQNIQTIMIFRFLQGVAASAPPAIGGGYLADFFPPVERGLAVAIMMGATQLGPILGPIIGGFVVTGPLGWRWTAWLTMIFAGAFFILGAWILPETFVPVLLQRKAQRLRFETKNWALHAEIEESPVDVKGFFIKYLGRPMRMICLEPVLLLMTLYMSVVYGFIYLLFEAFPVSYIDERGYSEGVGALPFIAIGFGVLCGAVYISWYTMTTIKSNFEIRGHINPEERIYPAIWGGILLPLGCFWFGWTSFPAISPWPQILAGLPLGAGYYIIFLQGTAYIIDLYTTNSNSAISANTIVRSLVGGGFPMFVVPMYKNLGVPWASSALGFLTLAFLPVPICFYIYGSRIRKLSRYAHAE